MFFSMILGMWISTRKAVVTTVVAVLAIGGGVMVSTQQGRPKGYIEMSAPWALHTIVAGVAGAGNADGADGVDLADINGDTFLDMTTPHEQGNRASVSLNPGPSLSKGAWSSAVIPTTAITGPEDAMFGDVDNDGWKDIIVGTEGNIRIWVLFSPTNAGSLLTPSSWTRVQIDASLNRRWIKVAYVDMNGDGVKDILAGGKEGGSTTGLLGYFTSATPRTAGSWTFHEIAPVGWVMSMYAIDVDNDGDQDVVYSDRERIDLPGVDSTKTGIRWFESDGADPDPGWTVHQISTVVQEHKFFTPVDWDNDGDTDLLSCRSDSGTSLDEVKLYLNSGNWLTWNTLAIPTPTNVSYCQDAKPVDINQDGVKDIALNYFVSTGNISGVVWLKNTGSHAAPSWERGEISGTLGIKYDNMEWTDLDADGDLDVVTTEQHEDTDLVGGVGPGLGLIWYENPATH